MEAKQSEITVIVCFFLGLTSCFFAVYLVGFPLKYLIAIICGLLFLFLAFVINKYKSLNYLFILFALSIPVNLDINFFYRIHEGGALGITISLSILTAFIIYFYILLNKEVISSFEYEPALFWPTLIYMAAGTLSLINASYRDLIFFELLRLVLLLFIAFIIMNIKKKKQIKTFIVFLCLGVLIQSTLAVIQYKTGKTLGLGIFGEENLIKQFIGFKALRATGTIGHPNILAYFFEIVLPIAFAMFLIETKKRYKLYFFIIILTGGAGLITTLSRASWLVTAISFPFVFFTLYGSRLFQMKTAVALFIIGIFAIIPLFYACPVVIKRLTHTDYGSGALRMKLNRATISVIKQFPVMGVGMNNFAEVFQRFDKTGKSKILKGAKNVVHNLYLLVWAEVGTVGFIAFLWIFVSLLIKMKKTAYSVPIEFKGMITGIAAGIMAHLIHGMLDPGFKGSLPISILIYTLIGIFGAISIYCKNNFEKPVLTTYKKIYNDI